MRLHPALTFAALGLSSALLTGCYEAAASSTPSPYGGYPITPAAFVLDPAKPPIKLDDVTQRQIAAVLGAYFGSPETPVARTHVEVSGAQLATILASAKSEEFAEPESPLVRGRHLYRLHCVHCHGLYGAGDGPTANFLLPRPRDFRRGEFKFTSTKQDNKPTLDDLKRTIAQGVVGTMMPAFGPKEGLPEIGLLAGFAGPPEFDVDAVAQYVRVLAMRGEMERRLVGAYDSDGELSADSVKGAADAVFASWERAETEVVKAEAPRPGRTRDEIARSVRAGDVLFHTEKAQCMACHGKQGKGNGLDADVEKRNKDVWGQALRPSDLTLGVFRGGRRPIDLYRRVHTGVKGGVMPGFGAQLKPEEIWNLVDYVQSLSVAPEPATEKR